MGIAKLILPLALLLLAPAAALAEPCGPWEGKRPARAELVGLSVMNGQAVAWARDVGVFYIATTDPTTGKRWPEFEGHRARANLCGADLSGMDLSGMAFDGADFRGADLSGARLAFGSWQLTDFRGATVNGANLEGARIERADFRGARAVGVWVRGTNYTRAKWDGEQTFLGVPPPAPRLQMDPP